MFKILIVDDETDVPDFLISFFKSLEKEYPGKIFSPIYCDNGMAALGKIKKEAFSLMITDLHMPGINGIKLITRTAVIQPELPIILMTGIIKEVPADFPEDIPVVVKPDIPRLKELILKLLKI